MQSACREHSRAEQYRPSLKATGRQTSQGSAAVLRELQVPGLQLEKSPPGSRRDRVTCVRTLSPCWLRCDQPRSPRRTGRRLLQSTWHGGTAYQGRQTHHPLDTPFMRKFAHNAVRLQLHVFATRHEQQYPSRQRSLGSEPHGIAPHHRQSRLDCLSSGSTPEFISPSAPKWGNLGLTDRKRVK